MTERLPLRRLTSGGQRTARYEIMPESIAAAVTVVALGPLPAAWRSRLDDNRDDPGGFLRGDRFNVYAGAGRVATALKPKEQWGVRSIGGG